MSPKSPQSAVTERIPEYLKPYIVEQDPSLYTAIDHASWRFIMKLSQAYFAKHAHRKYLDGLRETGVSTDHIPLITEMDEKLRKFGWRCVGISGFIPPAVFMEFLSLGILPIACDMRKLENLAYTPAPDIVHEAAGHAPIIADPEYAEYLRNYGEISQKSIYTSQDLDAYEAIRALSDIKEDPASTDAEIAAAQERLDRATAAISHVSEATQLARMSWWTIEYGLVGTPNDPKIYGAGLLSSVSESFDCLKPSVRKVPFDLRCIEQTYDITKPQPQLFVSPDFQTLTRVLKEFAETLAFKRGGIESLNKAVQARVPTTTVLDSGVQISGTLAEHTSGKYLKFTGPCQLSHEGHELDGQGAGYHTGGFGTPVGRLRGGKSPAELKEADLAALGFKTGASQKGRMEFESGVIVTGVLSGKIERAGHNLVLCFTDCKVELGGQTLFKPEWGTFDMACGTSVVSVFGGAADHGKYLKDTGGFKQKPARPKSNLTSENRELNALYTQVRDLRRKPDAAKLAQVHVALEKSFPEDWLLRYELLELDSKAPWAAEVRARLSNISRTSPEKGELIARGMELL
jgi:phenylalanine-4-hydroxylase